MTTTATNTTTPAALDVREVSVPSALVIELEMQSGTAPGEIAGAMGNGFATLMRFVHAHKLVITGAPRAIYQSWSGAGTRFSVAMPIVDAIPDILEQGVTIACIPEQRALRFTHHGSYQAIKDTYARIDTWLRKRGAIKTDADWARYAPLWEEYVSDPNTTPEEELMTYIYLPLP
jgi:hypothetical protein